MAAFGGHRRALAHIDSCGAAILLLAGNRPLTEAEDVAIGILEPGSTGGTDLSDEVGRLGSSSKVTPREVSRCQGLRSGRPSDRRSAAHGAPISASPCRRRSAKRTVSRRAAAGRLARGRNAWHARGRSLQPLKPPSHRQARAVPRSELDSRAARGTSNVRGQTRSYRRVELLKSLAARVTPSSPPMGDAGDPSDRDVEPHTREVACRAGADEGGDK
jgi:hypothetical protein